jgi:hypothetical protein
VAIVSNADGTVTVQFDIDTLLKLDSFAHDMVQQCFREPIKVERFVGGRNVPKGDYDVMHQKTRIAFMGEQATADYFGAPYTLRSYEGYTGKTDVDGIEVRTTDCFTKRLITHTYDKPAPFVLAVADFGTGTVVLRGWATLRECNVAAHWWNDAPQPAYFTPPTVLHPMHTLLAFYNERKRR